MCISHIKKIASPLLLAATCGLAASPAHSADDAARGYPSRPIRIVIGFTPGGQPDIVARMIAPKLGEALGQQIVIDNRPGAGGTLGTKIVVDATADGHTLLTSSSSHAIAPVIYAKLPYDPLKDLAGITTQYTAAYVLVASPTLNVKSVSELVALAKASPGKINYSSAGTGSGTHFAAEVFKQATHIDAVHIPYKGIPEALTDVVAGRVQFTVAPLGSSLSMVREGRLRGIAVTSLKRLAVHPNVPTVAESGYPGFHWNAWSAVFAPAKTPRAIIDKLNREFVRQLNDTEIQQRMTALGIEAAPATPAQTDQFVASQITQVKQLAQKAGIQAR